MANLNQVDYWVIGVYFAVLIALGLYLKKRASASLEGYLLGNRSLPWWALGVSGMASFLDITGTMIIVSFLFMLGPRGLFIEFRGGAVLVLAIYLLWTGKWHRRSGCMTGAEWMVFRFGEGRGGQAARIMCAVSEVIFTVGMLTYMAKGVGLFLAMFLPYSPAVCSLILMGVATAYTMISGFYGVVFTDMFQSVIILVAVVSISVMAFLKVTDPGALAALAEQVTGSKEWLSSVPHWHTSMPAGYEMYKSLGMFALFYLLRNIFYGMGHGDDPKFFGARNDRECGTLSFLWTWLMMFRWPMMMGFAVLGLFLVKESLPDQGVILQAADLVKHHFTGVTQSQWAGTVSTIIHDPQSCHAGLITGLSNLLGDDWTNKLQLISFKGTVDPERILPAVILFDIPKGLRGLLLVALIAASMSTFDSTVNRGTGYFTRDLYQRYLRPRAGNRELIYASWAFVAVVSALGLLMGNFVKNINDIWDWITMGLGAALTIAPFFRFYWWRFNGEGFAFGMAAALLASFWQRAWYPELDSRLQFLYILGLGLVATIIATYATQPTDRRVLERFYARTRPFGFWAPIRNSVAPEVREEIRKENKNDLLALPFTLGWQITLFLIPMQLIVHAYGAFAVTLAIFLACLAGMYVFWYRHLPPAEGV